MLCKWKRRSHSDLLSSLLCIVCGAVAVAIGIYVLKQRRLQRLKDPRKDYYR